MEKTVKKGKGKETRGGNNNPLGIGGFSGKPGPGRGKKKAVREAGQQIVEEMEYAYANAELPTDTVGVKSARRLAHDDYPKFLAMYLKAKEMAGHMEAPRGEEVAAAVTAEAGVKEEKVESLALRLLNEWELQEGVSDGRSEGNADTESDQSQEDCQE